MNEFQQRIGVGDTHYGLGRTGPTRERRIIADEGPNKGEMIAIQTDHSNGRVDANVFPKTIHHKISMSGGEV